MNFWSSHQVCFWRLRENLEDSHVHLENVSLPRKKAKKSKKKKKANTANSEEPSCSHHAIASDESSTSGNEIQNSAKAQSAARKPKKPKKGQRKSSRLSKPNEVKPVDTGVSSETDSDPPENCTHYKTHVYGFNAESGMTHFRY